MKNLELKENMIIVVPSRLKKKIIKKFSEKGFHPRKILTVETLRKKYEFDYDDQALYYLMKKYGYQYDVAKMYLSHLLEVEEKDFGSAKIRKIIEIKKELMAQNLLIFQPFFLEYLKGKTLVVWDYDSFLLEDKKLIQKIGKFCSIEYYTEEEKEKFTSELYELDTIEEEVVFVANKICELIEKNVPLQKIKLCGVSGEYNSVIKRIFSWYHLPITFQDDSLYATKMGQDFLTVLSLGAEGILEYLKEKYPLTNQEYANVYYEILTILNHYVWMDDLEQIRDFIVDDLKSTMMKVEHFVEEITIVDSLDNIEKDDYVFLMGFNQGEIPKTYKDESYFNDILKEKLDLETTAMRNQRVYEKWRKDIEKTKNLVLTFKKMSSLGVHYLSSLNDDLNFEVQKGTIGYRYSHLYNQIKLVEKIDTLIKYNEKDSDLEMLYTKYANIPYGSYCSDYQKINSEKVRKYLDHKLVLSYSAMNTYYQCGFRYYLSNILKLNIFEETFYTVLGNLFHYILSICLKKEICIEEEYQKYLSNCTYLFNSRERFFLNHLEKELEFIVKTIKKQNEFNSLNHLYAEEKIVVSKNKEDMDIKFKGFVDKMLVNDKEDIVSIIDYKTGNPDLNLNHTIYGLDLQLPVYLYLARKKFPGVTIAGFYLQKILNNEISKDFKHSYEYLKEEKLKLQGYSNKDESILGQFDSHYYESHVIKGMRTTSKGISSKKILSNEEMDILEKITEKKIDEAIENIIHANFEIDPKRVGTDNLGCKYCQFKDICFRTEKDIIDLKEYKNMEFLRSDLDGTKETE